MNNLTIMVAATLIYYGICLVGNDIRVSIDCSGGNKAACGIAARKYEAR
jgi:hypothetical protein